MECLDLTECRLRARTRKRFERDELLGSKVSEETTDRSGLSLADGRAVRRNRTAPTH